jgi:hypothetical protein
MLNPSFQPEPMHLTTAAVANAKPSSPSTNKNQLTKNRFTIMKKSFLILSVAVLAISANAQQKQKNALKVNPLSLLIMTGNVSYERALSGNYSAQLGAFYSGAGLGDLKYQGYGIVPEFRFYFGSGNTPLNGGYLAPFGRYQVLSVRSKEIANKASFTTVGGGLVAGYQKKWEGGFILNVFAGPSFNKLTFENNGEHNEFDLQTGMKGFGLRTGITLGIAF